MPNNGNNQPKKPVDEAMKQRIAEAVASLPHVLEEEMKQKVAVHLTPTPAPVQKGWTADPIHLTAWQRERKRRRWLWIGVGVLTSVVFGMWLWTAQATLYDIRHTKSEESHLVKDAKQDLSAILKEFSTNEKQAAKDALKESLAKEQAGAQVKAALLAALATTTTTSTVASTTTTPSEDN
ncbi:MAG TPA: hypothetical protein VEA18_02115 [Candidatus Kapabacteria bacterium]|nr:hypothetical protein [Candidatus Kapabacteria bacterium]